MEESKKKSKVRRTFSTSFKKEKVEQIEAKKVTVLQLSRVYNVSETAIYNWIEKYGSLPKGERVVVEHQSQEVIQLELMKKIAALEQKVGQQQMGLDYYQKLLEFGSREVNFDIEKKFKSRC
jgi:transposase